MAVDVAFARGKLNRATGRDARATVGSVRKRATPRINNAITLTEL